ncbi:hypothetical protein B0H19DRAFT_1263686 [Mycena capillaripes]|nr:hypothetical protein B0H19DRAFT_1263686 [Mycena capillaripes]
MPAKSPNIFEEVHHLFLDGSFGRPEEDAPSLLRQCINVVNLTASNSSCGPRLLPILDGMQVRKLSVSLEDLFGVQTTRTPPTLVDFAHPLFLSITHLDVYDDVIVGSRIYLGLAGLPALTHLALSAAVAWDVFWYVLSECKRLEVLVNLWPREHSVQGWRISRKPPIKDLRFVVTAYRDYYAQWYAAAEGGVDFWEAAERFIAQKRRGKIPGKNTTFYLYE